MAEPKPGRADLRTRVLATSAVALVLTVAFEAFKERFLPGIARWDSHFLTIVYVTSAAAALTAFVHEGVGRMRDEVAALQGWGDRNEAALQAFLDAVPTPAFLLSPTQTFLRVNDAMAKRVGRPAHEIVGRSAFSHIKDPQLVRARSARIDAVFQRRQTVVFRDANGDRHYVNHLSPVLGPDGEVWAAGIVAVDITDLHTTQERLQVSEELLRFGLAAARLGVWEWDICRDEVVVSASAIQLLGGPDREWRGTFAAFLQHVEPQDRARVEESFRTAAAGRAFTEPLVFRGRTMPREAPRWVEVQGRLFRGPEGRVRMVGTVGDATMRMESEARRERAEHAVRLVTGGTAGHTGHEFFSSLVEALARCLGARWVLAGRLADDGASIESLACWADGPAPDVAMPLTRTLEESLVAGWQPTASSCAAVRIVSGDGKTVGVVAALDDKPLADLDTVRLVLALSAERANAEIARLDKEAEIMRLNADLERRIEERTNDLLLANRELEAFSYSVSHDLRAPLRSIDGFALALLEDHGESIDPEARQYVEIVRRESQRMGQLIDDLLGLARLTRGRLDRVTVAVSEMAAEIVEELRRREPGRSVEVSIEPNLEARADANLLRVALGNLIGNAWKFTGRRAHARIELGSVGGAASPTFYIRDNGAGFDSRLGEKLFQPFTRLHPAADFEGTGIGLATVARIIKRHGGDIVADSRPGEGATFRFTLREPREADRGGRRGRTAASRSLQGGSGS